MLEQLLKAVTPAEATAEAPLEEMMALGRMRKAPGPSSEPAA